MVYAYFKVYGNIKKCKDKIYKIYRCKDKNVFECLGFGEEF